MTFEEKLNAFRAMLGEEKTPYIPDVETVHAAVCAAFNVPVSVMTSPTHEERESTARFASYHFCYQIPGMTLAKIGRAHGGRDHGTVLHGIRRIDSLKTIPSFKWAFERAERLLTP